MRTYYYPTPFEPSTKYPLPVPITNYFQRKRNMMAMFYCRRPATWPNSPLSKQTHFCLANVCRQRPAARGLLRGHAPLCKKQPTIVSLLLQLVACCMAKVLTLKENTFGPGLVAGGLLRGQIPCFYRSVHPFSLNRVQAVLLFIQLSFLRHYLNMISNRYTDKAS